MNNVSILSPAVSRMLHDKFYEKRKTAALEIEKLVDFESCKFLI